MGGYGKHLHTPLIFVSFLVNLVKSNAEGDSFLGTYVFKRKIQLQNTSCRFQINIVQIVIQCVLAAFYLLADRVRAGFRRNDNSAVYRYVGVWEHYGVLLGIGIGD